MKTCSTCKWWDDNAEKQYFSVPRCTNPINFYVEWDTVVKARLAAEGDTCREHIEREGQGT